MEPLIYPGKKISIFPTLAERPAASVFGVGVSFLASGSIEISDEESWYSYKGLGSLKSNFEILTQPSGFDWTPPVSAWIKNNIIETDYNADSWKIKTAADLYVDGITGNDTTGTGSSSAPYKSIWKAISVMTGATTIYVASGVYNRNNCWKAQSPAYDCNIIGIGGSVTSSMRWEGGTWTLTTNGTYAATRSTVGCVVDLSVKTNGTGAQLKKVASQALCEAEAGTWATDNVTVWVHTSDSRSPDSNVLVMIDLANGYMANDVKIYCSGINFEGGLSGGFATSSATLTANSRAVFDSCRFSYSKGNGLSNTGIALSILNKCSAYGNLADGFNYHMGANNISPKTVEISCIGFNNGDISDTNYNDNAFTIHEACRAVRYCCSGGNNIGPTFADIDQSMSWNIACVGYGSAISKSISATQCVDYQALSTAKQWFDSCQSLGEHVYAAAAAYQYAHRCFFPGGVAY